MVYTPLARPLNHTVWRAGQETRSLTLGPPSTNNVLGGRAKRLVFGLLARPHRMTIPEGGPRDSLIDSWPALHNVVDSRAGQETRRMILGPPYTL